MDGTLLDSMDEWYGLVEKFLDMHSDLVTAEMHREMLGMRVNQVAKHMHENFLPDQMPDEIIQIGRAHV